MPRGRHRNAPPLHRRLAPLTVAGCAAALAAAAWCGPVGASGPVLRVLVTAAAAVACGSAVLLRVWDRAAGRQVAELRAATVREEWRAEERAAELESEAEESRAIRRGIEGELRAKRAELAQLRNEHAELLRRYANAESERARALESRRRLAIEAAAVPRAIATPTRPAGPDAYRRAAAALRDLAANAARQQAAAEPAGPRDGHVRPPSGAGTLEPRPTPPAPVPTAPAPVREHHLVPAAGATAVQPYARPRRSTSRAQGGFDFFGTSKPGGAGPDAAEAADTDAGVIDLTAHDTTEPLDLWPVRAHS